MASTRWSRPRCTSSYDETRLLARLVNDLHELAQAEAHRLPLCRGETRRCGRLAATHDLFRPIADQKGDYPASEGRPPCCVQADPARLQQVLHNLVGNALRHTPAGGTVTLSCAAQGDAARFRVADTGPGILLEDQPHVFDRFYRADRDRARPADALTSGAGLGLAIVKALVEAQGGVVGIESLPGRGATFWFTLPTTA